MHQGNEIAVASYEHKSGHVGVKKEGLHCVDTQIHIDAILDGAPGAPSILVVIVSGNVNRFDRVGVQRASDAGVAVPVSVSARDHHAAKVVAAVHNRFEIGRGIEFVAHAHINVFEVDEDRDIRSLLVIHRCLICSCCAFEREERGAHASTPAHARRTSTICSPSRIANADSPVRVAAGVELQRLSQRFAEQCVGMFTRTNLTVSGLSREKSSTNHCERLSRQIACS